MMVPFDQTGVPQQGQPQSMRQMPPGHVQASPSAVMQGVHHQQMNPPMYSHRGSAGMPGQPPPHYGSLQPPSPAQRQGSFTGGMPNNNAQFSSHPPLHQAQPPSYPQMGHPGQMHHPQHPQMGRTHSNGMGMPPMQPRQHDPMRSSASGHRPPPQQPPPPQQQPQQYMNNPSSQGAMNGTWQSERDTPHRREMIQHIVKLLRKDRNSSPESANRLPQMAKHLEVSLYRNAPSFEAYTDMSTLKSRLHQIAAEVSRKSRSQTDSARDDRHHGSTSDRAVAPYPAQNGMRGGSTSPYMGNMSNGGTNARMASMDDINPMSSTGGGTQAYHQQPISRMNPPQAPPPPQPQRAPPNPTQNRNDPDWKQKIRHKQQRLLLLHHSAKCPQEGPCQVTPHCLEMKKLWRHMEGCKNNNCPVPHCFSSRAILSHYRKCKDPSCPACGPVRETVRKSQSSSRGLTPSSGPLMSSMRASVQPHPQQHTAQQPMVPPVDNMAQMSTNSFGSVSAPHQRSSPATHSGMPPPGPGALPADMQYSSSQYRQSNSMPLPPGGSVQPLYRSDQPQNNDGRGLMDRGIMDNRMQGDGRGSMDNRRPVDTRSQMDPSRGPPMDGRNQMDTGRGGQALSVSSSAAAAMSVSSMQLPQSKDLLSSSVPTSVRPAGSSESEWQKIRHKQQRLLLLRHASRCQHEVGTCPVTPHCASMKKLWEHIAHCRNQSCKVQHCLSSRYVLSHYRRCKNSRCPSCGPVRDSIRRSTQREKRQQPPGGVSNNGIPSFDSGTSFQAHLETSPSSGFLESSPSMETGLSNSELDLDAPSPPISATPVPSSSMSAPAAADTASPEVELPYQPDQKKIKLEGSSSNSIATVPISNKSASIPLVEKPAPEPAPAAQTVVVPATVPSKGKTIEAPKQHADHSLLNSFTLKELETHLASLDRKAQLPPAKLKAKCLEVLKGLQTHTHGWVFNCPVDPVELGLPDYFDIIKKPMDLGTIQKRLESGAYHEIKEFEAHTHLTFDNAMTYNEDGSVVWGMAKELKTKFEADMKKLMSQLEEEDCQRRQNERACTLCGCEKLLFEPPVYFCNGINCQSQRIRRNNNFYIGGNNQYFWCSSCYNELDDKIPIELVDMTIMKKDLRKKRNDEVHEESWVQCDTCNRWVHQICGLFNTRQNKEHHSEYCCPRCLRDKRKLHGDHPDLSPPGAADLPRTTLSEWLEKHIAKPVERKKRELAEEKAQSENIPLEEALKESESGGPIYVRQVTAMDRKLEVRELMKKRYAHKNYPDEFPFRCKCIVVFQELDGVDVILFALYVYEHGENNPPPNQRVVYISYLDSVHFMRPRRMRTFVYHEILIAYLDYARRRGYATAHIWACPPLKGDDYIFFAKPEDQKTPRDNRLRMWYIDLLVECQKRNIVGKLTNMYDLYFANKALDATAVPYLEGDYFPGEAENIIKMLEEGKGRKSGNGGKKKTKKATKSKGTTGTRSTGVDEEALIASGFLDDTKSYQDLDRDEVMVRLGETIQPMKESFIVAFLNWSGAKEEDMVVPEAIEKARLEYATKGDNDMTGSKRDAMGNIRDTTSMDKDGRLVKVIDDDVEDLDCEFLNNRQAFLNLCRGNHYQFDELRRAKHTSMMVLWHLHNRDAPKFVQQCVVCSREILSGKRYHCNTCPDYDVCQECFSDPKVNRGSCSHKLTPIAVESDSTEERNGLTDAERKQRQRNLMMHIQLIEHASGCVSDSCTSSNCAKMKNYLHHASICSVKVQGGCKICKRIWTLLRIHAQKCKKPRCPIPQCTAIREKLRQLQKQQQAMDDRRRLEMNRHMRIGVTGPGH